MTNPSKTYLQSEIDRLKKLVATKNMAITDLKASTNEGLRDLFGTYRHLRPLLEVLKHAAELQDPSQSPDPNPGRNPNRESRHLTGGSRDRARVRDFDEDLEHLVDRFKVSVGDISSHRPIAQEAPRCRRKECKLKGRRQSFDQTHCRSCNKAFDPELRRLEDEIEDEGAA